jgi:ribosome-binding ATPase YchF (GTP1/OBG family)
MANFELKKMSDDEEYKGFANAIADQQNEISYGLWTKLILGQGGILRTLQESNVVMKDINGFMAEHAGNQWQLLTAGFIEAEEDDASGTVEKLKHLKKAQANSMILNSAANELALRIKEDQDEEKEKQAEEDLRMQELEELVKKQQEVLGALLDRHRNALHEDTKQAVAKSEEISAAAMKAHQLLKKAVREARKSVATEVTEYANNIDKEIEAQE